MRLPAFETIAKPHRDILRGNSTADTYAARLGQVVNNEGPREYKSAQQFFQRTHITEGLKGLLSGVEGRLKGRERQNQDPIIQLQTPFGGGKTHTLIALYHKAKEWKATPVVLVGSGMDTTTTDTFWGQIETQLTGNVAHLNSPVAPGSNSIAELFRRNDKPVMILMDEVLHYLKRAAGVAVESSTLADQTIAFMLSLTEAVVSSPKVAFIVTLQESEMGPIVSDFPLFTDLLRRMRRTITPVNDTEVASIIRSRLFSKDDFNQSEARRVVRQFAKYAKDEGILPTGTQESEYRDRFLESYPFQPEVIDVLYHRWGSFPEFQRTRGVLRLLSRVVHCACRKNRPYITLADFDLSDNDIRETLLEPIDTQYRSVLASDITGPNAGARTVDTTLGETYGSLGTRTATTIFLYSFTGGVERGAQSDEIKRSTALLDQPAAIIDTARNLLTEHLFYLRTENGTSYFDTQPNLQRIVRTRMENVDPAVVQARVATQLRQSFRSGPNAKLKTYVSPKASTDIPDTDELKLVVLSQRDDTFCQNLIESRREGSRICSNTLFFILPLSGEVKQLKEEVEKVIAYEDVERDSSLNLSNTQIREIKDTLRQAPGALDTAVRQDYRLVLIPTKDGFEEGDLGVPAVGMQSTLDETVYDLLKLKGAITDSIGPRNISLLYLKNEDSVSTEKLLNSSLRARGEKRVLREAWISGIRRGVADGVFALGENVGGTLVPHYFKDPPLAVTLDTGEVIVQPTLIRESITPEDILHDYLADNDAVSTSQPFRYDPQEANEPRPLRSAWEMAIREGVQNGTFGLGDKTEGKFIVHAFRQEVQAITLNDNEVLIRASVCSGLIVDPQPDLEPTGNSGGTGPSPPEPAPTPTADPPKKEAIGIRFTLPKGKMSDVARHIGRLQNSFESMQIELRASEGDISQEDYEELKEEFQDLGIEIEEV